MPKEFNIQVEYSNRHIHPSRELVEQLFGEGYELTQEKKLSQGDDFAAEETVQIVGPKGSIEEVRIIGPEREKTQIEVLLSDVFKLGMEIPVRLSGDLENTPGVKVVGPIDEVNLEYGVIVAKRHIHISSSDAQNLGIEHGNIVRLKVGRERGLVFENVMVRVDEKFNSRAHIDLDEANACGISQGEQGVILID